MDQFDNPSSNWGVYSPGFDAGSAVDLYTPQVTITATTTLDNETTTQDVCGGNAAGCLVIATGTVFAEYTVTYTPNRPGEYNVSVAVLDFASGTSPGVGASPFAVTFSPNPSPSMVAAVMSDELSAINVYFDLATDQGGVVGSEPCSAVLSAATVATLGSGATCLFETNATELWSHLRVTLGNGATIVPETTNAPGNVVEIAENAVLNQDRTSYFASGSVQLTVLATALQPVAVLDGPTTAGICNAIRLSAANSGGGGSRALRYEFAVTSPTGQSSTAEAAIAAQSPFFNVSSIFIAADAVDAGSTYTFTLTVTNFIGATSTSSLVVVKEGFSFAQVRTAPQITSALARVDRIFLGDLSELVPLLSWSELVSLLDLTELVPLTESLLIYIS